MAEVKEKACDEVELVKGKKPCLDFDEDCEDIEDYQRCYDFMPWRGFCIYL